MAKKARKPKQPDITKQWAYRPPPTQTAQEIMRQLDGENMVSLLHELFACMPGVFKEALKSRGFLQFKVRDYSVLITTEDRFDRPTGTYGKAMW